MTLNDVNLPSCTSVKLTLFIAWYKSNCGLKLKLQKPQLLLHQPTACLGLLSPSTG